MRHIEDEYNLYYEYAVKIRRDLHKIPEEGFKEYKTSQYIKKYLIELGVEIEEGICGTGIIGLIKGKKGNNTVAFRADMDGLTIEEKTDVSYSSIHKGKMHACGHDGHMTVLLLLAKYLTDNSDKLSEDILLVFQPAEEGPGGALPMIEQGILNKYNVKTIFGLHIMPSIKQGKIGCIEGPIMAQTGEFYITVNGKSCHGARPQKGIDSIVITAQIINAFQTIISRKLNPVESGLITIGTINGGERLNIIAEKTEIKGTVRAFTEKNYLFLKEEMQNILSGFETCYNCNIDVNFIDMYPPVTNDSELYNILKKSIDGSILEKIEPMMIAEDFAYFQKEVPGLFFFLGSKNDDKEYIYDLHSNNFNFDEKILLLALKVYINILREIKHYD